MEVARLLNNNQSLTLSEDAASLINDALRAVITEIIANIMVSMGVVKGEGFIVLLNLTAKPFMST